MLSIITAQWHKPLIYKDICPFCLFNRMGIMRNRCAFSARVLRDGSRMEPSVCGADAPRGPGKRGWAPPGSPHIPPTHPSPIFPICALHHSGPIWFQSRGHGFRFGRVPFGSHVEVGMPRGYEKMRDRFKAEGMSDSAAKGKAARIWNSRHPGSPVTGSHRRGKPRK